MVSISCITYNHENYIRETLDSMLMQKTNFKYEILIHDDASTDTTAEIIKEYKRKYPDIIKPILQVENQYSKGIKVGELNRKRALGRYIAICEGDDYWTDENKLQKQVDYMEANPECTFCFHNAIVVDQAKNKKTRNVIPWMPENRKFFQAKSKNYTSGELQLLGFIPTASFMFPKYVLDNPPKWFLDAPVGDNAIKLLASSKGYAYYIDDVMCIYRFNVPNSATTKWKVENNEASIRRCERFIQMLERFNQYTNHKYDREIQISMLTWKVQILKLTNRNKELRSKEYNSYFDLMPLKYKIGLFLFAYFPLGFNILSNVNNVVKKYT